jgi:Zn-dependent peptidase ImmA (M78 family)/transcriptional regulator with XRE-family HTH domain
VLLGTLKFNPRLLRLAREAAGLPQSALSKLAGCSQGKLSKIEDGVLDPTVSDLKSFADHLKCDLALFFQKGAVRPPAVSFYRKAASAPLKLLNKIDAEMNLCRLQVEAARPEHTHSIPHIPTDRANGLEARARGAQVARQLRFEWKIPTGRIDNLIRLLEVRGCIVIHKDFETPKLDAFSLWGEGIPFIFMNASSAPDRIRATVAHELGHLVMHREPHEDVEEEAWGFAMEFLVPGIEVRNSFYRCNLNQLAALKKRYGVSMQALLKYGQDLGKIDQRPGRFLWMQMGKFRMREPFEEDVPRERPQPLETWIQPPMDRNTS